MRASRSVIVDGQRAGPVSGNRGGEYYVEGAGRCRGKGCSASVRLRKVASGAYRDDGECAIARVGEAHGLSRAFRINLLALLGEI